MLLPSSKSKSKRFSSFIFIAAYVWNIYSSIWRKTSQSILPYQIIGCVSAFRTDCAVAPQQWVQPFTICKMLCIAWDEWASKMSILDWIICCVSNRLIKPISTFVFRHADEAIICKQNIFYKSSGMSSDFSNYWISSFWLKVSLIIMHPNK